MHRVCVSLFRRYLITKTSYISVSCKPSQTTVIFTNLFLFCLRRFLRKQNVSCFNNKIYYIYFINIRVWDHGIIKTISLMFMIP